MHQSAGVGGTASDIAIQAEVFSKWKHELARSRRADRSTVEQILKDSDRDRWFTAGAKDYGFVDHVLTRDNPAPKSN